MFDLKILILVLINFLVIQVNTLNIDFKVEHILKSGKAKLTILRDDVKVHEIEIDGSFNENLKLIKNGNEGYFLSDNNENQRNSLNINYVKREQDYAFVRVSRTIPRNLTVSDCVSLEDGVNWYGGPQQTYQYWPVQKSTYSTYSYVTKQADNAGVTERYWLNSLGGFIYVDLTTPLFITQNEQKFCLIASQSLPYDTYADEYKYAYNVGIGLDSRQIHLIAVEYLLNKPSGYPDERMVRHPIWSTWARYKRNIDTTTVTEFADEILKYGFSNSQFEIDDDWEVCYGALTFNQNKFPNIKELVSLLKTKGFRVTLWIHPFININCKEPYDEATSKGYLVKDHHGNTLTEWWNSGKNEATSIDFTNPAAAEWFSNRLKYLQDEIGIDSFKFDAGETSWSPADPVLTGPANLHPSLLTIDYVRTVAKFGPMVEVRSAQNTQDLPIFLRIIDKDSVWGFNNGLPTLITTLLTLNMVGYPLVLPDMIGGNGYEGAPDKEMFIRWLAANVFMPSLQFSYVPWDYDNETVAISHTFTKLHDQYSDYIIARFKLAVATGEPVNPPLWWIDPTDERAQGIYDQFLLGDDIIVAPVIEKSALNRTVYLPKGNWKDGNLNRNYTGPLEIRNYPAPLNIIPYFIRIK